MDSGEKFFVAKGFDEKSNRTAGHGRGADRQIVASGDDNYTRLRRDYEESRHYFQTAHAFHPDVEHHERHRVELDVGEESLSFVKGARRDSIRSQQMSK